MVGLFGHTGEEDTDIIAKDLMTVVRGNMERGLIFDMADVGWEELEEMGIGWGRAWVADEASLA